MLLFVFGILGRYFILIFLCFYRYWSKPVTKTLIAKVRAYEAASTTLPDQPEQRNTGQRREMVLIFVYLFISQIHRARGDGERSSRFCCYRYIRDPATIGSRFLRKQTALALARREGDN